MKAPTAARRRLARPAAPPGTVAAGQARFDTAVTLGIALASGVAVAAGGTLLHRWQWADLPVGLVLALAAVFVGAVFARGLARGRGLFGYLLLGFLTNQVMTFVRPGGDLLVGGDVVGYGWLLAQPVVTLAALLLPRRWFADLPEAQR